MLISMLTVILEPVSGMKYTAGNGDRVKKLLGAGVTT
jgi:hypothetical protein